MTVAPMRVHVSPAGVMRREAAQLHVRRAVSVRAGVLKPLQRLARGGACAGHLVARGLDQRVPSSLPVVLVELRVGWGSGEHGSHGTGSPDAHALVLGGEELEGILRKPGPKGASWGRVS